MAVKLSSLAYKNEAEIEHAKTQAFPSFFVDPTSQITQTFYESTADAQGYMWTKGRTIHNAHIKEINVHRGFYKQFESIAAAILGDLAAKKEEIDDIVVCGHSLGTAIATIAAVTIAEGLPDVKVSCYTCGSPRVGNENFVKWFHSVVHSNWRIVNEQDPVMMIPFSHRFVHVNNAIVVDDMCNVLHVPGGDVPW